MKRAGLRGAVVAAVLALAPSAVASDAELRKALQQFGGSFNAAKQDAAQRWAPGEESILAVAVTTCREAAAEEDPELQEYIYGQASIYADEVVAFAHSFGAVIPSFKQRAKQLADRKNVDHLSPRQQSRVDSGITRILSGLKQLDSSALAAHFGGQAVQTRNCELGANRATEAGLKYSVGASEVRAGMNKIRKLLP